MQNQKKPASITVKMNALSDEQLITRLHEAAAAGVKVQLIIRGIYSALVAKKTKHAIRAISIVDEYLEHSRVIIFEHGGKPRVFISSADWMVRNLDHRVEAAVPVKDKGIRKELQQFIAIQLSDNVKARVLDEDLRNDYVSYAGKKKIRSQAEIFKMLAAVS